VRSALELLYEQLESVAFRPLVWLRWVEPGTEQSHRAARDCQRLVRAAGQHECFGVLGTVGVATAPR
jgi:hypothetical protein